MIIFCDTVRHSAYEHSGLEHREIFAGNGAYMPVIFTAFFY
jgi:hypothetical protein